MKKFTIKIPVKKHTLVSVKGNVTYTKEHLDNLVNQDKLNIVIVEELVLNQSYEPVGSFSNLSYKISKKSIKIKGDVEMYIPINFSNKKLALGSFTKKIVTESMVLNVDPCNFFTYFIHPNLEKLIWKHKKEKEEFAVFSDTGRTVYKPGCTREELANDEPTWIIYKDGHGSNNFDTK